MRTCSRGQLRVRAGQTAGGSQTWRATNKKAGTVPLTVPALQARFLLPCPPCASTTIGTFGRTLLLLFTPTEGVDETLPNSRRNCPGGVHGGRAKLRERRRRFGPGGAVTMPTLRYQCMRRMAVDVKPNCRAAFVPAVSCSRNTRVVWRRRETRVGPRGARKAIGGRSRGAGPRRRGAAAGESRGRSACARAAWRRSCEAGGGAHEG